MSSNSDLNSRVTRSMGRTAAAVPPSSSSQVPAAGGSSSGGATDLNVGGGSSTARPRTGTTPVGVSRALTASMANDNIDASMPSVDDNYVELTDNQITQLNDEADPVVKDLKHRLFNSRARVKLHRERMKMQESVTKAISRQITSVKTGRKKGRELKKLNKKRVRKTATRNRPAVMEDDSDGDA